MPQSRLVSIQHLFDTDRLSHSKEIISLIVWFPIGLCLLVLRLFIGLHAFLVACLFPKTSAFRRVVLRGMCAVLGIVVRESDVHLKSKGGSKVIVTNHVTNFDHLAVDLVHPCIAPGVWDLPKFLNWTLGFRDFGVKSGRQSLISNVKAYLSSSDDVVPILTHPEGATTNGRVGLLKFSTWPFSLDYPVHPIIITVNRSPIIKVAPSIIGSRWWSDLFWILMSPWTTFCLRYLEPMKRRELESEDDYTKRSQTEMASAMGWVATNFSDADKVEYAKRLYQESLQQANSSSGRQSATSNQTTATTTQTRISPQLDQMAQRVKEVLPQVPLVVIRRDLAITANVDESITRLLDGSVTYTPEAVASSSQASTSSRQTPVIPVAQKMNYDGPPLSLNAAAKSFGKNATERMKSYEERKALLIEACRQRYLSKRASNPDPSSNASCAQ